jgi:hypothetical protein
MQKCALAQVKCIKEHLRASDILESSRNEFLKNTIPQKWQKETKKVLYILLLMEYMDLGFIVGQTDDGKRHTFRFFPFCVFYRFVKGWFALSSCELKLTHYIILTKKVRHTQTSKQMVSPLIPICRIEYITRLPVIFTVDSVILFHGPMWHLSCLGGEGTPWHLTLPVKRMVERAFRAQINSEVVFH